MVPTEWRVQAKQAEWAALVMRVLANNCAPKVKEATELEEISDSQ